MENENLTHQVRKFYAYLTDKQFLAFCLYYGYNNKGKVFSLTEISQLFNTSPPTVFEILEQVTFKLGQSYFRELVEALAEYE